jgi:hypothetical protein
MISHKKTLLTWIPNTKDGVGVYIKIQPFPFAHGHLIIQMMCFSFKCERSYGIHDPFTIGIQTPSQLQSMISLGDNEAISMDATFGTNFTNVHIDVVCANYMDHYKPPNMQ